MKLIQKKGKLYVPTSQAKKISVAPQNIYTKAKNRIKFWRDISKEISWIHPSKKTYTEKGNKFSWFKDGTLNLCYNAVDRNLQKPEKTAILFIPENPKEKKQVISYSQLYTMVNNAASILKEKGVKKGDVVAIYMPMIPEALAFMLACARIGAIHSVVFSAFSPEALKTRIKDGNAKVLVSANYYYHGGKKINLEEKAKEATNSIKINTIMLNRKNTGKILLKKGKIITPEIMNAEDTAFILYTSGTTGKPKGVMHAIGGYTVQAYASCKYVFNLQSKETIWCTADIGWITGHTYACYGPLLNNATTVIFEGLPNFPKSDRYLKIIEENNVNALYTAPTAIRMFATKGNQYTKKYTLKSLKVLGSVGEPIDEKAWNWYFINMGKKKIPIIDTYFQTETGSIVMCSLPGIGPFVPTFAGKAFPGIQYEIVDDKGKIQKPGIKGTLVQVPPFSPSLIRNVWKNEKRYNKYFENGNYIAGDNAYKDTKGNIRILGRSDDIIKVAGHRISTAEIENAIAKVPGISEVAIVGKPDKIKGEVIVAFIRAKKKLSEKEIIDSVIKTIGPIAKPKEIYFVNDIPKTRSGKMMRRILKALASGEDFKNVSTLVNPESVEQIKKDIVKNKSTSS
jgi:acetyl-CoA synthetase